MTRKIALTLLWLGFLVYAFKFSPPPQANTWELISDLSLGNWKDINPLIIGLFNLTGVWPGIYGCLLFIDGRGQKFPAWPFAFASFAVGAFALLPYLILRQPNPHFAGPKNWFLKWQDSRLWGIVLTLTASVLLVFALTQGDWKDFIEQWQTSSFIQVMSTDFCLLCLLFPTLLGDDLARRGVKEDWIFWLVAFIPLLGPLLYLCWRPNLPATSKEERIKVAELQ